MDIDEFLALSPEGFRKRVPAVVSERVGDPVVSSAIYDELTQLFASWSDAEVASVRRATVDVGVERRLHEAHGLARVATRVWSGHVLKGSVLEGAEHLLEAVAAGPTVVVCNHRAYVDSNAIDMILQSGTSEAIADRLVSVAGPKVYEGLYRRMASTSLNTIPVPQSAKLNHTANLPGRELARQSLTAVAQAHEAMKGGRVLLIFPEGARTRSGKTQPFLPAVFRYFKMPEARVVPAALTGTDQVMRVGASVVQPSPCTLRFGPSIAVDEVGGPREALVRAEQAVGTLLPPAMRPDRTPA